MSDDANDDDITDEELDAFFAANSRPKSSPAAIAIATMLAAVLAVVVIGGIAQAKQNAKDSEDCARDARIAAARVDFNDIDALERSARDLRFAATNC